MNVRKAAAPIFDALLAVAPNTNMLEVTALVDGMRAVNRMGNAEFFRFRIATSDGHAVTASNGFPIPAELSLADAPLADHVFVLSSYELKAAMAQRFQRYLRKVKRHKPRFYGIDQGSVVLAAAGLLDGHRATTHWEVLPSLLDRFPDVSFVEELYVVDRQVATCAGHTACIDLIVHITAEHFGAAIAASAMQEMIYGRLRNGYERQRLLIAGATEMPSPSLGKAVSLMSSNLDAPLSIARIAERCRISRRQLENLSNKYLGCSPAQHYMKLRLSLARELLLYSSILMIDISNACGFASQANFSRAFVNAYGTTPSRYRRNFSETLDRPIAIGRQEQFVAKSRRRR